MKYRNRTASPPSAPLTAVRLGVGVLGCSDIAGRKFIPALAGCSGGVLAAIASRSKARAEGFAPEGFRGICSHEELLESPHVDLVYLSLPNHLHEEWAIRALRAGKHVICEKPLGLSPESVERMLAAAEENGRLLYENLMFLHHPRHAVVKQLVEGCAIGRVVSLRAVFTIPLPRSGNFRLDPDRGGGALHDLSRYPLGAALYHLGGVPRDFRGHAIRREGLILSVHGTAITPLEEVFTYAIAFGQQYQCHYEMVGERGLIYLERAFTPPADLEATIMVRTGGDTRELTVPPCDQFGRMIEDVAGLIRTGDDFRRFHDRSRLIARLAREMEEGCHG